MATNLWKTFRDITEGRKLFVGRIMAHDGNQSLVQPIGYVGESYYAVGTSVSIGSYAYIQKGTTNYVQSEAPTLPTVNTTTVQ